MKIRTGKDWAVITLENKEDIAEMALRFWANPERWIELVEDFDREDMKESNLQSMAEIKELVDKYPKRGIRVIPYVTLMDMI